MEKRIIKERKKRKGKNHIEMKMREKAKKKGGNRRMNKKAKN